MKKTHWYLVAGAGGVVALGALAFHWLTSKSPATSAGWYDENRSDGTIRQIEGVGELAVKSGAVKRGNTDGSFSLTFPDGVIAQYDAQGNALFPWKQASVKTRSGDQVPYYLARPDGTGDTTIQGNASSDQTTPQNLTVFYADPGKI